MIFGKLWNLFFFRWIDYREIVSEFHCGFDVINFFSFHICWGGAYYENVVHVFVVGRVFSGGYIWMCRILKFLRIDMQEHRLWGIGITNFFVKNVIERNSSQRLVSICVWFYWQVQEVFLKIWRGDFSEC